MARVSLTPDEESILGSVVAELGGSDETLRAALGDHLQLRVVMELYIEHARQATARRDSLIGFHGRPEDALPDLFDRAAAEFDRLRKQHLGPLPREAGKEADALLDSDVLSIREASLRFGIPGARLRRLLARGHVEGAHKVPGARSGEWRVPAGSLRALGFEETAGEGGSIGPVRSRIRLLGRLLVKERRRGGELDRRLGGAIARITQLEDALRDERERRRRLESEMTGRRVEGEIDLTEGEVDVTESEDQDRPRS